MSRRARKLLTYVDVDQNTPIQKLGVIDQLRVLIRKLSYDDSTELMANDAVVQNQMQLKADLLGLVDEALKPIRMGKRHAVSLSISNEFDPVIDEVFDSPKIRNYYDVTITRPDIEYDVKYNMRVDLVVKF